LAGIRLPYDTLPHVPLARVQNSPNILTCPLRFLDLLRHIEF